MTVAPRLIIFDCDGVLVDSESFSCEAVEACLAECGIGVTSHQVLDGYLGRSLAFLQLDVASLFARTLPEDFAAAMQQRVLARFTAALQPIDGVAAAIDALNCRVCVASSSQPKRIRYSLALAGLLPRFDPHIFSAALGDPRQTGA